jgi:hypothetical protein
MNKKRKPAQMGVYGLMTFLGHHGKHYESLRAAVKACGRPLLLIDAPGFLYHIVTGNAFVEAEELAKQCRRWVETIRGCGAEPIFFWDGVHSEKKMRTLKQRREEEAKLVAHLYARAINPRTPAKGREPAGRVLPLLCKEVLLVCLRELGVECHQSIAEADGLIASYYTRNKERVLGVVSGDSDFFIFPVALLPLHKLVCTGDDYRFDLFENEETAHAIGLKSVSLLPLFSCLVGNDYTREELSRFPNFKDLLQAKVRVTGPTSSTIRNVAAFCNTHLLEGRDEEEQLAIVDRHLLINCRNKEAIIGAFRSALRIIHGQNDEDKRNEEEVWAALPRQFRAEFECAKLDNSLLGIVWKRTFWSRLSFYSAELELNPITRAMRLRLFGFLLQEKSVSVTEYFQQAQHFVFENVLSESCGDSLFRRIWEGVELRDESARIEAVLSAIVWPGEEARIADVMALDARQRLGVVTLRYLMRQNHETEEPFLFVWEPMVVLLHLLAKHFGCDLFGEDEEEGAPRGSSRKVRALLLKVPVSRTISVAAAFQVKATHFFFFSQF